MSRAFVGRPHPHRSVMRRAVVATAAAALALLVAAVTAPVADAATRTISGTVTFEAGADLTRLLGVEAAALGSDGESVYADVNLATGAYALTGLTAERYRVTFIAYAAWDDDLGQPGDPGVVSLTWPDASEPAWGEWIGVASGDRTGVNVTLPASRSISGTATLPAGAPQAWFAGVEIVATEPDGGPVERYATLDPTTGAFEVGGLPPGRYELWARIHAYLDESTWTEVWPNLLTCAYPGDCVDFDTIATWDLTGGSRSGIELGLVKGRSIAGTVTVEPGARAADLAGVTVQVRPAPGAAGSAVDAAVDPATGAFAAERLIPGVYGVEFVPEAYASQPSGDWVETSLLPEYWDDQIDESLQARVDVRAGDASGVDAELADGHAITGTVSLPPGADGDLLGEVAVAVETLGSSYPPLTAWPDPMTGAYRVDGVRDGATVVEFAIGPEFDWTWQFPGVAAQWYADAPSRRAADRLVVDGSDVAGIDADLAAAEEFTDVSGNADRLDYAFFAREITWLANAGITRGYPNGDGTRRFSPYGFITRDAMAAFLYRYAGSPAYPAPPVSPFTDVTPASSEFYKEICWLASTGITTGWNVGGGRKEFRPYAPITRDAMAAFLYRFSGSPAFTVPAQRRFVDVGASQAFVKEIEWLGDAGISLGWPADAGWTTWEYRPFRNITRDAMAAFLFRLDRL